MGSIWRHYHRLMEAKPPRSVCPRRRDDAQTYFSGWDVLRWRRKRPSQFSVLPQAVQVTILPVPQRHRALPSPARRPLLVKIARAQIFSKCRRQTVSAMGTSTSVLNNDHCLGQILAHWYDSCGCFITSREDEAHVSVWYLAQRKQCFGFPSRWVITSSTTSCAGRDCDPMELCLLSGAPSCLLHNP